MTETMNPSEELAVIVPITTEARQYAHRFASQQATAQKRKQVVLNTLAVCAVHDYMQRIGFQTARESSESWNPSIQLCSDVADLEIVGAGKLECRPVKYPETDCQIPAEAWHDRIGYVPVQIHLEEREAKILGFIERAATVVTVNQLRSLADLIDHLHNLMEAPAILPTIRLDEWLQGIIETGWQTVESLFGSPELAFRTETIRQAKLIDLGLQLDRTPVGLIVELTPDVSENRTRIRLQVRTIEQVYLPPNLRLVVLDDAGETFLEAQSRQQDNLIQLQFSGRSGESFRVAVMLGEAQITEQFLI
ncbi:DUF1822 family protein [Phormidesmis sp. 146-35]